MPMSPTAPFPEDVARQASAWLMLLWSGELTDTERRAWQAWLHADPEHARAWRHIEQTNARFRSVPTEAALRVAAGVPARAARRRWLKGAALGLGTGSIGLLTLHQYRPLPQWTADYRIDAQAPGRFQLDDGTQVTLDARSAMNVRFDDVQRRIQLLAGRAYVQSAPAGHATQAASHSPLFVDTPVGRIQPLDAQFIVGQDGTGWRIDMLRHAARIAPAGQPDATVTLAEGQAVRLSAHGIVPDAPADADTYAWIDGMLVARNRTLDDVIQALRRYRPGYLGLSPDIAHWRLSGVYPLGDTDRILDSLADTLPVRIVRRSRYWVRIVPLSA